MTVQARSSHRGGCIQDNVLPGTCTLVALERGLARLLHARLRFKNRPTLLDLRVSQSITAVFSIQNSSVIPTMVRPPGDL
jgi:hypothetical protein